MKRRIKIIAKCSLILIIVIFLAVIIKSTIKFLKSWEYFKIEKIKIESQEKLVGLEEELKYNLGRNIFNLDLNELSRKIEDSYLYIHQAKIMRILPDTLKVDISLRQPKALINLGRYFFIDEEGVLLPLRPEASFRMDAKELPEIRGLEHRTQEPPVGGVYESGELKLALSLLKELSQWPGLKKKVSYIDVEDISSISFITDSGLEVRMRGEDFREKLKLLDAIFLRAKREENRLKVVDLRFKNPIIRYER